MWKTIVLVGCLHLTLANVCDRSNTCVCDQSMGSIVCAGHNISTFPTFQEDIRKVTFNLEITNTSLTAVPQLSDWPVLVTLRALDNVNITCRDIFDLHDANPLINILSDCYSQHTDNATTHFAMDTYDNNSNLAALMIFPILIVALQIIRSQWMKLINIWNDFISTPAMRHPIQV